MGYTANDAREAFYYEILQQEDFPSVEVLDIIKEKGQDAGFYEVCSKFADIGLNAPKRVIPETCDVQASFQFSDIEIAKTEAIQFFAHNNLKDFDQFFQAISEMHYRAVAWDDQRVKSGRVLPQNYTWQPGFAGKYINFCQLPEDILDQIYKEMYQSVEGECK